MKRSILKKVLYTFIAISSVLPYSNFAQAIKRQCISSIGTGSQTDGVIIHQTVGQSYGTKTGSEPKGATQGFQQPISFLIKEVKNLPPFSELDVQVFPNPAKYTVTIESEKNLDHALVRVIDINGKHILTKKMTQFQAHSINCESWTNGVYLITIDDSENNRKTVRLVISK